MTASAVTLNRLATKCRPAGDRDQMAANSWHDRKMTTDEFLTSGSCLKRFFLQIPLENIIDINLWCTACTRVRLEAVLEVKVAVHGPVLTREHG